MRYFSFLFTGSIKTNNTFAAPTQQDINFMARAIELAPVAQQNDEIPVGALVVADGEIIGEGYNQCIGLHDPSAHAEIMALRAAGRHKGNYRLVGATVYLTLEPCAMCAMAMVHARVARVVYGASDYKTGAHRSVFDILQNSANNHQPEVVSGVLDHQCSLLLSRFFKNRRAIKKQQRMRLKKKEE